MATNGRTRLLLLAIVLLSGFVPFLEAQSVSYFIDTESGEPRFKQRLEWAGGEYALRYEVVIERETGGTYVSHLRESTEASFIEVSLPPGHYRFQVTSYDILDRPEEVSRWVNIEVRPAVQPEVFDISPEFVSGGDGEPSGYVINISGHNLVSGGEFIVRRSDGTEIIAKEIDSDEGDRAEVSIDSGALAPGEYEIVIRNPGGLEARRSGIVFSLTETGDVPESVGGIEPLKPILLFAGAAWAPVLPLHGDFFGQSFSPAGADIRIGAAFSVPGGIYIGAELAAFWHVNSVNAGNDDFGNILSAGVNLLVMKWLANQITALNFRLGLSTLLVDTQDNSIFNIGASYIWRFTNKFLLEAGFDYAGRIKQNSFDGSLRPWIGVGIIF